MLSYRQAILGASQGGFNMDIEKTMQFLLEQQARFDARQAQFDERQAEFVERQVQFEERMAEIQNLLQDIATSQINTSAILATLVEQHVELERSHIALFEAHRETEQSLKVLSESQNVTEQNLSALIITVERHIASHS
jgi:chromosome segregation ATPase